MMGIQRYVLKFETVYFIVNMSSGALVVRRDGRDRTFIRLDNARRALAKLNNEG